MSIVKAIDLVIVLTGGSTNTNPNDSLGGDPSSQPLVGVLNNLFDNITEEEATVGKTEYRCMYIFNNNTTDAFYEMELFIVSEVTGGATVEIGVEKRKETQKMIVSGSATGGTFDITYTPPGGTIQVRTVTYDPDPATWAINLQNSLNSISTIDCLVGVSGSFTNRVFNINFQDYRNRDLISLDITNLIGGTTSSVSKTFPGSPINSIPPLVDSETTAPFDVNFSYPTIDNTLKIGTLYAEEGFPLWVKRTVAANTDAIENDGFKLRIVSRPISP